jgi:hypothetical protein
MDRGRGSMLMSAVGEVTATPGPAGTTVVIRAGGPRSPPTGRSGKLGPYSAGVVQWQNISFPS